jgi:hypothetical protein
LPGGLERFVILIALSFCWFPSNIFAQAPTVTPRPEQAVTLSAASSVDSESVQFNPDPGAPNEPESVEPPSLFPPVIPPLPRFRAEPLPRSLELPRRDQREVVPERRKLPYEEYPEAAQG